MSLLERLHNTQKIFIRQRFEMGEVFGFETRNKYSIETESGTVVGFSAEQQKGIIGFLFRHYMGHWRRYDLFFFDNDRRMVWKAHHPFRFFFQRFEIEGEDGRRYGALQQRFAIFGKKFDVEDQHGRVILKMRSPIWRIWTFNFFREGKNVATISKKWSGILSEAFTDKDHFLVEFKDMYFKPEEKALLITAAIFVDMQYFERKA